MKSLSSVFGASILSLASWMFHERIGNALVTMFSFMMDYVS